MGTFTARELADAAGVMTKTEKRNVSAYIREYIKHGVMKRVENKNVSSRSIGCRPCEQKYRYIIKSPRVTDRQRLWNVVRRLKGPFFDQDHLEMMTGIRRASIKHFCIWLVNEGHVERLMPGKYRRVGQLDVDVPPDKRASERVMAGRRKGKK